MLIHIKVLTFKLNGKKTFASVFDAYKNVRVKRNFIKIKDWLKYNKNEIVTDLFFRITLSYVFK